jgi:anti-sigma regulatory factor (Ser/Thr protein kinase)
VEVRAGVRLTPATLVQLASACYALRQAGHHPVFRADDAAVHEYLWRCAFFAVVQSVVRIEPPVPMAIAPPGEPERRASPLLLDVTRLETSADLPPLLDQILRVLRQRLPYRTNDACDVTTAVSELCQNIFDHNAQTSGFVAMQVMGCRGHRHLEVGVADYGAGLAATLQRNPQHAPLASDLEAIHLAVQCGTSTSADPTWGPGSTISSPSEYTVQCVKQYTGTFTVSRVQPATQAVLMQNRLGLCITTFNLSEQP